MYMILTWPICFYMALETGGLKDINLEHYIMVWRKYKHPNPCWKWYARLHINDQSLTATVDLFMDLVFGYFLYSKGCASPLPLYILNQYFHFTLLPPACLW
jgi:hypothetical protein